MFSVSKFARYLTRRTVLKGRHSLVVHFSYHKCMTNFFINVYSEMARAHGFHHAHHNGNLTAFYGDVERFREKPAVISVNNQPIDFSRLPSFKGTHLVRDPRDLLLSGYRYHLWCGEPWALEKMSDIFIENLDLESISVKADPRGKSYQEFLNILDPDQGLLVELNWRRPHFDQMMSWNYSHPDILELKYEEIFGDERRQLERVFRHVGFSEKVIQTGCHLVEKFSFRNIAKTGSKDLQKHASVGRSQQWKDAFPRRVLDHFYDQYGELLQKLDYRIL